MVHHLQIAWRVAEIDMHREIVSNVFLLPQIPRVAVRFDEFLLGIYVLCLIVSQER